MGTDIRGRSHSVIYRKQMIKIDLITGFLGSGMEAQNVLIVIGEGLDREAIERYFPVQGI